MPILELLNLYNITYFKITDTTYGNSLRHGRLKQLIIYNRFIHDASEFNALGFGVICRDKE